MKSSSAYWLLCAGMGLMAVIALWAPDVWASDPETVFGTSLKRSAWDLALKYINFIILATLIFKYARTPVVDFIMSEKSKTARTIEKVEEKKHLAEEKIQEGQRQLEASESRLNSIKERIVDEGKKRRDQMIAAAQEESRLMLQAARMRVDSQIREARSTIRNELIDTAFDKALKKLPQVMTDADQQELIKSWVSEAQKLAET